MAGKISDLTAATAYNDADEFELLQSGNNLRLTKTLLRKLLFGTGTDFYQPRYDADTAVANYVLEDGTGYRRVSAARYSTTPNSTSQFAVSNTDDFETRDSTGAASGTIAVGLPVRFVISGTAYYGVVTAGVANTSITIAGAPITGTFSALSVGPPEKVVQLVFPMTQASNFSADTGSTHLATFGLTYFKWRMSRGYLVTFSGIEKTTAGATEPKVNVLIGGSAVSTNDSNNGITLSAATWVDNSAVAINTSNYDINWDDTIEFDVTNTPSTAADYLTMSLTFVLA